MIQTDRRRDRQTDGRTDGRIAVSLNAPTLSVAGGIITTFINAYIFSGVQNNYTEFWQ